jgi:hypothetical protein
LHLVAGVAAEPDHHCGSVRAVSNPIPPQRRHGAGTGIGAGLVTVSRHVEHTQARLRMRSSRLITSSGGPKRSRASFSSMPGCWDAGFGYATTARGVA